MREKTSSEFIEVLEADAERRLAEHHEHAEPLSGRARVPFFTRGVMVLCAIALGGLMVLAARFVFGIGAVTNLDDQYPWGIWIGIDVATGVALAAGGFTTAFLAHILNLDRYHSLVRPALLTAMLGYTFAATGVAIDLGRYYNIWHVLMPPMWQGNSALFEVGMCVTLYLTVLYIEFLPIVCERFIGRVDLPKAPQALNDLIDRVLRVLDRTLGKVIWFFIIMGVVLSCAHQSSLGTLMAIAPSKLHPLWHTPVLPLLFLLSAFAVGLAMATFESLTAARSFKLTPEMPVLRRVARLIPFLLLVYLAAKVIDMVNRGSWVHLQQLSLQSVMFMIEVGVGVVLPMFLLLSHKLRRDRRWLHLSSALVVLGVALNRVNVFIIGYKPPYSEGPYVPAWSEVLLTAGLISLLILLYRAFVWVFPVLPAEEDAAHA